MMPPNESVAMHAVPLGIRGVNPDSNQNLQSDQQLLESKKEKCIELFKSSTMIHETI
jgi:hypothetical protein